jgi:DNA repair exonuclease SbcCD ATPase subunit
MILFKTIRWKNFLSTGNTFTEVDLTRENLTLVVGDNGAGKSTILDALCFALFNKPFRKVTKTQLINSINNKESLVELEFKIGTKEYKIRRGMKPNVFELFQNGLMMDQSADKKDYQDILENQILKMNFKSFCQVVIIGSASFVPFMQLPTGDRRKIIEDLLDLQIFSHMNQVLKAKASENAEEQIRVHATQQGVEGQIKIVADHLSTVEASNAKMLAEKKERLEATENSILHLRDKYSQLNDKVEGLKASIADEKVSARVKKLDILSHQIKANLAAIEGEKEFFTKNDDCPTCRQLIDKAFKSEVIAGKDRQIDEIKEGLVKLTEQYETSTKELNDIMSVQNTIQQKSLELHALATNATSLMKYAKDLKKEIESTAETMSTEDTREKLQELIDKNEALIDQYNELVDKEKVYIVALSLLRDDGIKSRIIKQYVPVINKFINKYLAAMDFFVNFELDENFNETIKSRHRDEFSYASFSEGEKMRINLAVLFTWRAISKLRNSASTNLLIMDEVLDGSLDGNGTDEFLKILSGLVENTNTFIISHKTDQMYDKFNSVLKFEKHKNFSRIAA